MGRLRIALLVSAVLFPFLNASAQFKEEAFTQTYNDGKTEVKDSVDVLFSFKDFFGGLGHKNEIKIGVMFAGSTVFPGASQIYNRQYWKLPIVYGGIGAGVGLGIHYNVLYNETGAEHYRTGRTLSFIGAGLTYWGALMDGVINYRPNDFPHPGKATLYSVLCPGLGQIYNKEYWKIPIYIGGLAACWYFYSTNSTNYNRFHRIYNEATNPEVQYTGPITADVALYYRDVYRRYRDYSVLAIAIVYLLQVIDANVFAYMHDFNMSDDLAVKVSPTIITPDTQLAMTQPAVGLNIGFKF